MTTTTSEQHFVETQRTGRDEEEEEEEEAREAEIEREREREREAGKHAAGLSQIWTRTFMP